MIDTPGIRVFRLHGVKKADIRGLFPEFVRYQAKCKYPNCTHDHEPDCGVLDALEEGLVPETRYMSYLEMLVEAAPDDFGPEEDVIDEYEPDED